MFTKVNDKKSAPVDFVRRARETRRKKRLERAAEAARYKRLRKEFAGTDVESPLVHHATEAQLAAVREMIRELKKLAMNYSRGKATFNVVNNYIHYVERYMFDIRDVALRREVMNQIRLTGNRIYK